MKGDKIISWLYGKGILLSDFFEVDGRGFALAEFKEGRQFIFRSHIETYLKPKDSQLIKSKWLFEMELFFN